MAIGWDAEVVIPADAHDLPGFLRWAHSEAYPDRGNIAFVSGELLLDMSPERFGPHLLVKGEVSSELHQLARKRKCGVVIPDGLLVVNEAAGLACEPDITYCHWQTLKSGRAQRGESGADGENALELRGSPDLVVEIVSPSSVRKDTVVLFEQYYVAGIDEYWLIDARGEEIEFELFTRGVDGFVLVEADADGYRRSKVLELSFALTRSTNEFDETEYHLLHREFDDN